MDDSPDSRVPLQPAELVSSRIEENRLFEASFLFNKFSQEIDQPLREKIHRQLTERIELAKQAFSRGELLEQAGDLEQAADSFREVAVLAIDHPGLVQARQRVDISIQLVSSLPDDSIEPEESEPVAPKPSSPVSQSAPSIAPATACLFFQHKKNLIIVASSLVAILGLCGVFLLFRADNRPVVSGGNVPAERVHAEIAQPAMQPLGELIIPAEKVHSSPPAPAPLPVLPVPALSSGRSEGEVLSSLPPVFEDLTRQQPLPEEQPKPPPVSSVDAHAPSVDVPEAGEESATRKVHVRPLRIQESSEGSPRNQEPDSLKRSFQDIYGNSWRLQEMNKLTPEQGASSEILNSERESRVHETFSSGNGNTSN